ncbi:maleylacetate reductase [Rhizobiaceae bacterium n13]|uniref:Maleylacetate reductase n=1 Tax=Ferirhizobium litorale TaxID=2927786 RepID=A0AAE3QBP5_9HYPH|nr:maleylacetate reductase [Fererhizobium litorale]MDI7861757.1 maleylacetate reductase [Fererhizobium litorale]MDI7921901.1 maleylacetate reductase [Fererhizobium litorale]
MLAGGFRYETHPQRIVFGAGKIETLPTEVAGLGAKRALIISTPGQQGTAEDLARRLGRSAAGICAEARMHTPVEVTDRAMAVLTKSHADCLVAFGGGTAIGLSKALALRTGLPQIVIPTTYAGSEMTPILGQTENGVKTTIRSAQILPRLIIYDVDLTLALPSSVTATSGMNAMAHAIEGLYARDRNPVTSLMALDAIRSLGEALPTLHRNGSDRNARLQAQYAAWLAGHVLGTVGMALHHKLCHTLGGSFDLPHAETHTVILPHVAAFNAAGDPAALAAAAAALRGEHAGQALYDLAVEIGTATSLKTLGMQEADLDRAAELAVQKPYWNPRPFDRTKIREILGQAFEGMRPARMP